MERSWARPDLRSWTKIQGVQVVSTGGLIKFRKFQNILLRTVVLSLNAFEVKMTIPPYPAPCWGGGGRLNAPPPSGFSRIAKIRLRAAPPGFHPPYLPSFPQLLWKFRPKAMWGQVTRSGQETQLQNNFPIVPRPQCFRESYETFGIWWGHQCLQNVYLRFFILVTSGQVIFAIISQWAKNQLCYIYFDESLFEWNHIV